MDSLVKLPGQPRLHLGALPHALSEDCIKRNPGLARCVVLSATTEDDFDTALLCARASWPESLADVSSELLKKSAQLLQETLVAAEAEAAEAKPAAHAAAVPRRYDLEPGDSSDEEGGSSDGIRLRVRVSRGPDERWGINWHKNIFKVSHKLVVDEIIEGSIIGQWNSCQAENLQLQYGDRLERINGVQMLSSKAQQSSAKLRAELQKQDMRALFWRPGSSPPAPAVNTPSEPATPASGVLLAAATCVGGLAAAASVAAAHLMLGLAEQGERDSPLALDVVLETLGEEISQLLRSPSAAGLLKALEALASPMSPTAEPEPAERQELSTENSISPAVDEQGSPEISHAEQASAAGDDATNAEEPQWTYSCRKCGVGLFHDTNVLQHQVGGQRKAQRASWGGYAASDSASSDGPSCTSLFVEPMRWMGNIDAQTGRLLCGNPSCKQKLGGYSWHGLPCSCGEWQSPAFQIHCARLDCHPARRQARGPAPQAVF